MIEPMASMALKAARAGARHIAKCYDRPDLVKIFSDDNGILTNVNDEVRDIIIGFLKDKYPEHFFYRGEPDTKNNDYEWLIAPLDGTKNFTMQIPHFSISIACAYKGLDRIRPTCRCRGMNVLMDVASEVSAPSHVW